MAIHYQLLYLLDRNLREDDIKLSLKSLSKCVAVVFGYERFDDLLHDSAFGSESQEKTNYVYNDYSSLSETLYYIASEEAEEEDQADIISGNIFDAIVSVLEELNVKLISGEGLSEEISDFFQADAFSLIDNDQLSAVLVDANIEVDNVSVDLSSYNFVPSKGFLLEFHGEMTGNHRGEPDVKGQTVEFKVELLCPKTLGSNGLGEYQIQSVLGKGSYW
uniref:hypothetical protein n=1 Tax=Thaumasiovibrio occultus TaxID=1891184 RepID=UPI00131DCA9F|nr:hypothetical protein [Thaumasiovibrio occultus]